MNFKVGGQRITTVPEETVKCLGRWFDESLKDINRQKEISRTVVMLTKERYREHKWFDRKTYIFK